ncbi:phage tail assembly chaperone [Vibrio chagasii]|uniref:phage tail assembly chaperone n=1 Tax=Vibrio chagasii TaxID=170679 RepID=UPI0022834E40|nr:phage tail assembly chaperone [Vibrio chagasii]MCY9828594.1 phage tail assembly chaperone [Vibrio chagasii]
MMTFQDAQMMEVKQVRARLMVEADHLVNTAMDNGLDETSFRQYRQALRDIPQTFSNPEDVVWPQKPSLPQASA